MKISEKIRPLTSKPFVLFCIIMILIFCFDGFYLKPIIKDHYLDMDLKSFKNDFWKYQLLIAALLAIVFILFMKIRKLLQMIPVILCSLFFVFMGFKTFFSDIALYINYQTEKKQITKTYTVINHKETKVFWLYAGEVSSIHDYKEIQLTDQKRKANGLKSLFNYNYGDTVQITFKKGIFKVNYMD
ncbi:hypothetical protein CLU96_3162 [Chryseobacterium sp. 52]|uniref:hypothetical protein n=1 Tax=Chryseobacterium sp. 52 TaxID=2035213 RepID=UPI000C4F3FF4|nr:hypothetical protein [Chryseobacterium sp. 52]PIF46143.1 hypothetical protein CLU96_3162 [Chryseobacterium sp. 52]